MAYIDGCVIPVPTASKAAYLAMVQRMAPLWKKHGATSVVESWSDNVPEGKVTSFTLAVQRKDDESVAFSWIYWPDKATRDVGFPKVMEESSGFMNPADMPFDGKRMIYGGFQVIMDV